MYAVEEGPKVRKAFREVIDKKTEKDWGEWIALW